MCDSVAFFNFKDIARIIFSLYVPKVSSGAAMSEISTEIKYPIEFTGGRLLFG